jgi:hypothetical protein
VRRVLSLAPPLSALKILSHAFFGTTRTFIYQQNTDLAETALNHLRLTKIWNLALLTNTGFALF